VTTSTVAAAAAVSEAGPRLHGALADAGLSATSVNIDHDAGLAQQSGQAPTNGSADPRAGDGSRQGASPDRFTAAPGVRGSASPADGPGRIGQHRARHPLARTLDLHV
jgi:hypothetical protein